MMKKVLFLISLIVTIFTCFTVSADFGLQLDTKDVIVYNMNDGELIQVSVNFNVPENMKAARLCLEYDPEIFDVCSIENGSYFPESAFIAGDLNDNPFYSIWMSSENATSYQGGCLATVSIAIKDNVEFGEYDLHFSLDDESTVLFTKDLTVNYNTVKSSYLTGSFNNIKKVKNYDEYFYDVLEEDWYYEAAKDSYELGFIGTKTDCFDAFGNFTANDMVDLIVLLNRAYHGESVTLSDSSENVDMDFALTRSQFANFLCTALPSDVFEKINMWVEIPDVDESHSHYADIYKLYASGIVVGCDEIGSFNPDRLITNAEVATILSRLGYSDKRIKLN